MFLCELLLALLSSATNTDYEVYKAIAAAVAGIVDVAADDNDDK